MPSCRRDIAAVASAMLTDPGVGDARDYLLTGPRALSCRDIAAIITAHIGHLVEVVRVGLDEQTASYRAAGMAAEFAAALAAAEEGMRAGREDQVSTAVLDLTGRPPRPFAEFVRDHATEWANVGSPGR